MADQYKVEENENGETTVAVSGKFKPEEIHVFLKDVVERGISKIRVNASGDSASDFMFMQVVLVLRRAGKDITVTWGEEVPEVVDEIVAAKVR